MQTCSGNLVTTPACTAGEGSRVVLQPDGQLTYPSNISKYIFAGYKMCGRLYLHGDGIGKGSHVSLYFVLMKGPYDPILSWLFTHRVTMQLMDQSGQCNHVQEKFRPDPNSSSFKKPGSEMNVATGSPRFISLTELERRKGVFVKDDTMFIRIIVEWKSLMQNLHWRVAVNKATLSPCCAYLHVKLRFRGLGAPKCLTKNRLTYPNLFTHSLIRLSPRGTILRLSTPGFKTHEPTRGSWIWNLSKMPNAPVEHGYNKGCPETVNYALINMHMVNCD